MRKRAILLFAILLSFLSYVHCQQQQSGIPDKTETNEKVNPAVTSNGQRQRQQQPGIGGLLSGLLGQITKTADVEGCPGKCIHTFASFMCDEVLANIKCPTSSMRCCVEKGNGAGSTTNNKEKDQNANTNNNTPKPKTKKRKRPTTTTEAPKTTTTTKRPKTNTNKVIEKFDNDEETELEDSPSRSRTSTTSYQRPPPPPPPQRPPRPPQRLPRPPQRPPRPSQGPPRPPPRPQRPRQQQRRPVYPYTPNDHTQFSSNPTTTAKSTNSKIPEPEPETSPSSCSTLSTLVIATCVLLSTVYAK